MAIEFTYTPEEFSKRVKAYHAKVETDAMSFPDLAGLKNALRIEDEEYAELEKHPEYHSTCLWAKRRRESFLNRAALTTKNAAGIKMLLAQPENGGYVEKPVDKTPRTIEVRLKGMINDDLDSDWDNDAADSGGDTASEQTYIGAGNGERKNAGHAGKPVRKRGRPSKKA